MKEIGTFIWKRTKSSKDIQIIFCNTLGRFVFRNIERRSKKRLKVTWKLLEDDFVRWGPEPYGNEDWMAREFRNFQNRFEVGDTIQPEHYKNEGWHDRSG